MDAKDVRAVAQARWMGRRMTVFGAVMISLMAVFFLGGMGMIVGYAMILPDSFTFETETGQIIEVGKVTHRSITVDGVRIEADESKVASYGALALPGVIFILAGAVCLIVWALRDSSRRTRFLDAYVDYWAQHRHKLPAKDWLPEKDDESEAPDEAA